MVNKRKEFAWGATRLGEKVVRCAAVVAGKGMKATGKAIINNRDAIESAATVTARVATKVSVRTVSASYRVGKFVGQKIYSRRDEIASAGIAVAKGSTETVRDALSCVISDSKFKEHAETIQRQSRRYRDLNARFRLQLIHARSSRDVLLDTLVVGGETVGAYASSGSVSYDMQRAYELAYPNVSAMRSFSEQINGLDAQELEGFVAGLKGKLFELQYVRYLNDGHLPDGFVAVIAPSANNPGWDIAVLGPDGSIKDTIQAKATESLSYVKEALDKHPQIDVVTTSEVYSHLLLQGFADDVIDSGIRESTLDFLVQDEVDTVTQTIDWVPSSVALALIAFSSYSEEELTAYDKNRRFAERASKSYLAYLVGGSLILVTQTWWIGVLGSMGSRFLFGAGRRKRDRLLHLEQLVKSNEQVLAQLQGRLV